MSWYDMREGESLQEARDRRLMQCPMLTGTQLEQLRQLRTSVWDGNLISKTARDQLAHMGFVARMNGWQVITREGLQVLDTLGEMRA